MKLYFSDFFEVDPNTIEEYGAFNISLVADLPLFVDPFLIFNSQKQEYQALHESIVKYLLFLHAKSAEHTTTPALISSWYRFPEIKENWLGFSVASNSGRGLGRKFARALHANLSQLFKNFGQEQVTHGTHLEKLCLVDDGVGRDNISDFTNNLIHEYLLRYTEQFAKENIPAHLRKSIAVSKVRFNYETETWESDRFELPMFGGRHVLLTPTDLLTKDETWINKRDLVEDFDRIAEAIPSNELRAQVNNYFRSLLPREPKKKDETSAATQTILRFPELIDYYIRHKEDTGDYATKLSSQKVDLSRQLYVKQFREFVDQLEAETGFYKLDSDSYEAALQRADFLKDVIENKGGHRIFYLKGRPIERESDLQILYRLTWFATTLDVSREVNDGRGPADFKVSHGASNKALVEMKLAKNTHLRRNLAKQTPIYEKASDSRRTVKVIIFFTPEEERRALAIVKDLKMHGDPSVVLIDARADNKPSASNA